MLVAGLTCLFPAVLPLDNNAAAASAGAVISEDTVNGRITVETQDIKGIWHYKALPSENYCQSGGNLFELFYKPTDPGMVNNLVNYAPDQMSHWGHGGATGRWLGVGGIGATDIYAADQPPADTGNNNFADNFADNNLSGELESHSVYNDASGNAVLTFSYKVHDQSTGKAWYRVLKKWTIHPDGIIDLSVDWSIVSSGYFSEPTVHNRWSGRMKWDRWVKYGAEWSQQVNPPKYLLSVGNLAETYLPPSGEATANAWSSLNAFQSDWLAFVDSPYAPNIVIHNQMGNSVGSFGRTVLEQNIYQITVGNTDQILGGYGAAWATWWGGKPPKGNRYQWLDAGTTWHHGFQFELTLDFPGEGPDIKAVTANQISRNGLEVSWTTNVASDSAVEIKTSSGEWLIIGSTPDMTQQHHVAIEAPDNSTFDFRVKSKDANNNLAISGGYPINIDDSYPYNLTLETTNTVWASFQDYLNNKLRVDFEIVNEGPGDVQSMSLTSEISGSRVQVLNQFPIELHNIPAGSTENFSLDYDVSTGVQSFSTFIRGTSIDASGNVFTFPKY